MPTSFYFPYSAVMPDLGVLLKKSQYNNLILQINSHKQKTTTKNISKKQPLTKRQNQKRYKQQRSSQTIQRYYSR